MQKISIIIPTLNEADNIQQTLQSLQVLRHNGHELILVDGGSQDHTINFSIPLVDKFISSDAGRAIQMNAGAKLASGDILLFLHADTQLPSGADQLIQQAVGNLQPWGRFDVSFPNKSFKFRLLSQCMNIRSAITGIVTGDHTFFIARTLFDQVGGFPEIPLMEDIAISRALLKINRPKRISQAVITSSRRWEEQGFTKTVLIMWWLRLLFFLGTDPKTLVQMYYPLKTDNKT